MSLQGTKTSGISCRLLASPSPRRLTNARIARTVTIVNAKKSSVSESAPQEVVDVPDYLQPPSPPPEVQYYQAVPQYPIASPPPKPQNTSFWSNIPPLVWIGIGVLIANGYNFASNLLKGGPQRMQQMAMEQMMNQMMKQAMGGSGGGMPPGMGANPFAGAAGFPGAAAGMGAGFPSGFPSSTGAATPSAAAATKPIDTTASPASTSTTTSSGSSSGTAPKAKKSAFVDVDATKTSSSSATSSSSSSSSQTSTPPPPPPPPPFGGAAGADSSTPGTGSMLDMLKNPEMQKMLYPYLPEPMRNPETFDWMLNNPEYRAQLEGMLSQQMGAGAPPAVQELMQGVDMNPDKMKAQFDALGMSPEEFIQKVMSDPELATSMTKPAVMAAIAECTQNPMNIFKYQNDEEVMKVFEKMSSLFPQAAAMGGMPGGMPAGMGGMPTPPPAAEPPVVQAESSLADVPGFFDEPKKE